MPVRFRLLNTAVVGFTLGAFDQRLPLTIDPTVAYATYIGGGGVDGAFGIAVDGSGNSYVTGDGDSEDFPTTSGAFTTEATSAYLHNVGHVTKFDSHGNVVYSTLLGGYGVTVYMRGRPAFDATGHAYVAGWLASTCGPSCADFPVTSGAFQTTFKGSADAFVAKLNGTGSGLVYASYLGGTGSEAAAEGPSVAVDAAGDAVVAGSTANNSSGSNDFPTTSGAFEPQFPTGANETAFVTKFSADGGRLVYSSYLGGSGQDQASAVALGPDGSAYVTGYTGSTNFPVTVGAFQTRCGGLPPCMNGGYGVFDAFVTRVAVDGSHLLYSSYLGGGGDGHGTGGNEFGHGIAVDSSGAAYVVGDTDSVDFPTTAGAFHTSLSGIDDAFVTKVSTDGSQMLYSTYLGGNEGDCGGGHTEYAEGAAVDAAGDAYVVGVTCNDPSFPVTADAFQRTEPGGVDAFVAELNPGGTGLVYSSYLGGSRDDLGFGVGLDSTNAAYVVGATDSCDLPVTASAFQKNASGALGGGPTYSEAFVAKIVAGTGGPINAACPVPAAPTGDGRLDPAFGTAGVVTTSFMGITDMANAIATQPVDGKIVVAGSTCVQSGQCGRINRFALARYSPNGSLDTGFGTAGKVTTDFANGLSTVPDNAFATAVLIQPDGRLVAGGVARVTVSSGGSVTQTDEFALARYNANGSLDSSFGSGGTLTVGAPTPSGTPSGTLKAMVLQPDGKIVAAGYVGSAFDQFVIMRFDGNGVLDTSFGSGGIVEAGIAGHSAQSYGLALESDGKIVAAGQSVSVSPAGVNLTRLAVARFTSTGALDSSFGSGGAVETSFDKTVAGHLETESPMGTSVVIQGDGKIVVGGSSAPIRSDGVHNFALARYTASGALDTSFGSGGIVENNFFDSDQVGMALALQSNGTLVIAGASNENIYAPTSYFLAARYLPSGVLDTTFGDAGTVETRVSNGGADEARALAIQSDGNLVAAGVSNTQGQAQFAITRYLIGTTSSSPGLTLTPASVTTVEGAGFAAVVGGFTDGDGNASASAYAATITWGDGTSSAGSVTGSGPYSVSGSHVYREEGPHNIVLSIVDADGASGQTTTTTATNDAALTAAGRSARLSGTSFKGVVATFTDADPFGTVTDYTASIAWGDGSTSMGTVKVASGGFTVFGTHTYAKKAPYTVAVIIVDSGGSDASATTSVR